MIRLTTEQMQKFSQAVGLTQALPGGQYEYDQLRELVEDKGGLRDYPRITNDPLVNHAVDCVVSDPGEEPNYDEQIYRTEIEEFKRMPSV